ncbi:MAG: hypothetical protein L3J43_07980 [Sulfurovum sp.]|nr:hypothetical protein [Sulfurovum sp.]
MINKRKIFITLIIMSVFVLNGCGVIATLIVNPSADKMLDYNTSVENQLLLQNYSAKGYKVDMETFIDVSECNKTVKCRLMTSVTPPRNETYAAYIEHAFQKEFKLAKLYKPRSDISLSATIHKIEGGSVYGNAYWSFDMTLASSNGIHYRFQSVYKYESSISAAYACSDMYKTFPLALKKLIHDAVKHPKFETLLAKIKKQ